MALTVPPACFLPRPKVDSAVVHLRVRKEKPAIRDEKRLFAIIRAAFGQRRKTLINALAGAPGSGMTKDEARAIVCACNLPENVRGEVLSLADFIEITKKGSMGA